MFWKVGYRLIRSSDIVAIDYSASVGVEIHLKSSCTIELRGDEAVMFRRFIGDQVALAGALRSSNVFVDVDAWYWSVTSQEAAPDPQRSGV